MPNTWTLLDDIPTPDKYDGGERLRREIREKLIKAIGEEAYMDLENREQLIDIIHELFAQGCYQNGVYDHMFISAYKDAQAFLLNEGRIKPEECYYK